MAALTSITRLYITGTTEAIALYAVYSATAADTISVSADFVKVAYAAWFSSTGTLTGLICTVSGTTVTVPAGPSTDDGYLAVFGARVQSISSP